MDEEGEHITIDDDAVLKRAIHLAIQSAYSQNKSTIMLKLLVNPSVTPQLGILSL